MHRIDRGRLRQVFQAGGQLIARWAWRWSIVLGSIGLLWTVASLFGGRWLPPPWHIAGEVVGSFSSNAMLRAQGVGAHGVAPHALATLWTSLQAMIWGLGAGFAVAIAATLVPPIRWLADALVLPWRIIPPLIAVPIAIVLAGSAPSVHVGAVAIFCAVSIVPYLIDALLDADRRSCELARVHGSGPLEMLMRVRMPAALPSLVTPLKLVGAFCIGIVVILEYVAAPKGLGRVMKIAMGYTSIDLLFVAVMWSVLLGMAWDLAVESLLGHSARWARDQGSYDA